MNRNSDGPRRISRIHQDVVAPDNSIDNKSRLTWGANDLPAFDDRQSTPTHVTPRPIPDEFRDARRPGSVSRYLAYTREQRELPLRHWQALPPHCLPW